MSEQPEHHIARLSDDELDARIAQDDREHEYWPPSYVAAVVARLQRERDAARAERDEAVRSEYEQTIGRIAAVLSCEATLADVEDAIEDLQDGNAKWHAEAERLAALFQQAHGCHHGWVNEAIEQRKQADSARAERDERDATIAKLRDGINALIHRRDERERTRDAIDRDDSHLAGVRHALEVFCRAFDLGGVSCGKLCEMLGHGISDLHSAGVQAVANAITDAADTQNALTSRDQYAALVRALVARVRRLVRERRDLHAMLREYHAARIAEDSARVRLDQLTRLDVQGSELHAARVAYRDAIDRAVSTHDHVNTIARCIAEE